MLKKFFLQCLFFTLAAVVVLLIATYTKVEVFNERDLSGVSCGWPLNFMTQNLNFYEPPFPSTFICLEGFPYHARPTFYREPFLVNVILFYGVINILFFGTRFCLEKYKPKKHPDTKK